MAKSEVKKLYNSKAWKQTREAILKRDLYKCNRCGDIAEEVHHVKHVNASNINDVNITLNADNLISLCRDCHCRMHDKDRNKNKNNFENEKYFFDNDGQLKLSPPSI